MIVAECLLLFIMFLDEDLLEYITHKHLFCIYAAYYNYIYMSKGVYNVTSPEFTSPRRGSAQFLLRATSEVNILKVHILMGSTSEVHDFSGKQCCGNWQVLDQLDSVVCMNVT